LEVCFFAVDAATRVAESAPLSAAVVSALSTVLSVFGVV
jgi:hypothetical protein